MKNDEIYFLQDKSFDLLIILSWILYILIAFNISVHAPNYLDDLEFYLKLYISLFLLYRFMPFRKIKFTDLDRKIAFNAGIFIFTGTAVGTILQKYFSQLHSIFINNL